MCRPWCTAYVHTFFVYLNLKSFFFLHSIPRSFASFAIYIYFVPLFWFFSFFRFLHSLTYCFSLILFFHARSFEFFFFFFVSFGRNKLSIQLMCWINTRMIFPCWPFPERRIYFYYFIRRFSIRRCFGLLCILALVQASITHTHTQTAVYHTEYDSTGKKI